MGKRTDNVTSFSSKRISAVQAYQRQNCIFDAKHAASAGLPCGIPPIHGILQRIECLRFHAAISGRPLTTDQNLPTPLLLLRLFLIALLAQLPGLAAAAESSSADETTSGYTEIGDCLDDDEDSLPTNTYEDRYKAGRMAFLFGQYEVAFKAWQPLAEMGYAKAQAGLAWIYHTGNGAEKNMAKATEWYQKAADQGDAIAQNNLGVIYENGLNGKQSDKQAAYWYREAALQGYSYAQYNLGMLYVEGRGVNRDLSEAKYWLQIASRQKIDQATEALGKLNITPPPQAAQESSKPRIAHAPYHSNPVAKGINWVKKQDPRHFTVQLARSKDMAWILKLAASSQLDQPMIHYQFHSKDDDWHVLIYGSFPTKAEAQKAIDSLPEAMRKWSPWIREFREVQRQLQSDTAAAQNGD